MVIYTSILTARHLQFIDKKFVRDKESLNFQRGISTYFFAKMFPMCCSNAHTRTRAHAHAHTQSL